MKRIICFLLVCLFSLGFIGCDRKVSEAPDSGSVSVELVRVIEGFDLPECLVIDPDSGDVFVSNVVTANEGYWDKDSNGFISRISADGEIKELRWLESTDAMEIHGPKGMCILDGKLYFNDIDTLKYCAVDGPGEVMTINIDGAVNLNDLASDGEFIWATDTDRGMAFRISADGEVLEIPAPEAINGITSYKGKVFAVSWGLHEIYELDPAGVKEPVAFGLADNFVNLDTIEVLDDGSFIVSDWKGNMLYHVSADRKNVRELMELTSAADVGLDRKNGLIYAPEMLENRAVILKLK